MRVLAHIHTMNDAGVIEQALDALRRQTRPPDAILIVDNASIDGTLDRIFPETVTIVRNPKNLGTSGAVRIGLAHALEHGFDWTWIFDADSVPQPDVLEKLLELYAGWPQSLRDETGFIACLPYDHSEGHPLHGQIFTREGRVTVTPEPEQCYYPCHITIWSGCMYRLAAVRRVGLPNPDYFLDRGELEYGYRMMKAGYKGFIHQDAVIRHNIGESLGPGPIRLKPGQRVALGLYELPPIRCYYLCRNTLYFELYESAEGRCAALRRDLWRVRPFPGRPGLMSGVAWRVALLTLNFVLRPRNHGKQIRACFRGIWHGMTGNMAARY